MRRMLSYWRIVFSAGCVLAAVLLLALWVRSSQKLDVIYISLSRSFCVYFGSFSGTFDVGVMTSTSPPHSFWQSNELEGVRQHVPAKFLKNYTSVWGRLTFRRALVSLVQQVRSSHAAHYHHARCRGVRIDRVVNQ